MKTEELKSLVNKLKSVEEELDQLKSDKKFLENIPPGYLKSDREPQGYILPYKWYLDVKLFGIVNDICFCGLFAKHSSKSAGKFRLSNEKTSKFKPFLLPVKRPYYVPVEIDGNGISADELLIKILCLKFEGWQKLFETIIQHKPINKRTLNNVNKDLGIKNLHRVLNLPKDLEKLFNIFNLIALPTPDSASHFLRSYIALSSKFKDFPEINHDVVKPLFKIYLNLRIRCKTSFGKSDYPIWKFIKDLYSDCFNEIFQTGKFKLCPQCYLLFGIKSKQSLRQWNRQIFCSEGCRLLYKDKINNLKKKRQNLTNKILSLLKS